MVTLLFKLPQAIIPCLDRAGEEEEVLFDAAADVKDVNGQGLKEDHVNWVMSFTIQHWQDIEKERKRRSPGLIIANLSQFFSFAQDSPVRRNDADGDRESQLWQWKGAGDFRQG